MDEFEQTIVEEKSLPQIWPGWKTLRLLGTGSYGSVYEIERTIGDYTEKAALKVISIPQSSSEVENLRADGYTEEEIQEHFTSQYQAIVREYSVMAKIKGHTNIVNCEDIQTTPHADFGWDIFIRMELLSPMLDVLNRKAVEDSGFSIEQEAIRLGMDICGALVLCEKNHIIHRDIKPQNILVSPRGDYKLGDFGTARTMEATVGMTGGIGTKNYMSPEVAKSSAYDYRADIYSLGMVLYWLLNERRLPFLPLPPEVPLYRDNAEAVSRRLLGEAFPPPAHGSEELQKIVLKACAFRREDRYTSASDMLKELEKLGVQPDPGEKEEAASSQPDLNDGGSQEHASAQDPTAAQASVGKKKRSLPVILVVIVLLLAITGGVLFRNHRQQQIAEQLRIEQEEREKEEAERLAREQAEREAAEQAAREEAEQKAREEAERLAREQAEREAAEQAAREEAEQKAREEAERLAREEAEQKAREEAERLAREEAEQKAREEAERLAREEAERKAREEAERIAREEAERKAREEAERLAREEAERKAREEAERLAREAAEQKRLNDIAAASEAEDIIFNIGQVTLLSEEEILTAREVIEDLTEDQLVYLSEDAVETLEQAEETLAELQEEEQERLAKEQRDREAAEAVTQKIYNIGVVSLDSKATIAAARAALDELTEDQIRYITGSTMGLLINAEKELRAQEKEEERRLEEERLAKEKEDSDRAAANAVAELIKAIGEVTLDSEDRINSARDSYDRLTEDQLQYLTAVDVRTLGNAEKLLMELQEEAAAAKGPQVGDRILFGAYEQNNDTGDGPEAIEWIVLETDEEAGRVLLLTRYGLETMAYNMGGSVTWENSSARKWLNQTFFNSAFSEAEQAQIAEVENKAAVNPGFATDAGNDTTDRVFLLSVEEVDRCFQTDPDLYLCEASIYAKTHGAMYDGLGNCWWWLRSPGEKSSFVTLVNSAGHVVLGGGSASNFCDVIRPAMWMNLAK